MAKLGPTGTFPDGSLGPHDAGALNMGITHDSKGNVIINFAEDVSWLAFPPEQAVQFAKLLLKHAGVRKVEITL